MSEYKKCPYCGEEILAVAKKCKYCREWLTENSEKQLAENPPAISQMEQIKRKQEQRQKDYEQKRKEQEQRRKEREQKQRECQARIFFYKTHDPSSSQKQSEMYGTIDKNWLLDEFKLENGVLAVSTLDGRRLSAPVEELTIRFQTDTSNRREVYITHGDNQVHFIEIPGMLSNGEWNTLFSILSGFPNTGETVKEKLTSTVALILGIGLPVVFVIVIACAYFWIQDKAGRYINEVTSYIESNPKTYQNEIEDCVRFEVAGVNCIINEVNSYSHLSSLEKAFIVELGGLNVIEKRFSDLGGLDDEINNMVHNNTSLSYEKALSLVANNTNNQYSDLAKKMLDEYEKTRIVLSDYRKISTSSQTMVWEFTEINTGILFRFSLDEKGYAIDGDSDSVERYFERNCNI